MQVAIGHQDIVAAWRVEGVVEADALAALQNVGRAQRLGDIIVPADRIDVGAGEADDRPHVAQPAIVVEGVAETGVREQIDVTSRDFRSSDWLRRCA